MKSLLTLLFSLCLVPCNAQMNLLKVLAKSLNVDMPVEDTRRIKENPTVGELLKGVHLSDTISAEDQKKLDELRQKMYDASPLLKKMDELKNDTAALNEYMKAEFGGMSQEEMARKVLSGTAVNYDDEEFQDNLSNAKIMQGFTKDTLFQRISAEQRPMTQDEATYFNEKYGTCFEYEGLEAYNDSIGVYAHLANGTKAMALTKCEDITPERPYLCLGQNEIKQYVKETIDFWKNPLNYKNLEVVDSLQYFMVFNHLHADAQFESVAKFTFYSNLETDDLKMTYDDLKLRKVDAFIEPIDPNNIFIFKVNKGWGCRFMKYKYTKLSYNKKEMDDYVSRRIINEGYLDNLTKGKISEEYYYQKLLQLEDDFKEDVYNRTLLNKDKYIYSNEVPAAKNVKLTSSTRKIGGGLITALDVSIEAEPGEYAFVIRNPYVEDYLKHIADNVEDPIQRKLLQCVDMSILYEGAFFFTIK